MSVKSNPLYRVWLHACKVGASSEWKGNFVQFCEDVGQKVPDMAFCKIEPSEPFSKTNFIWKDNPRRVIHASLLDVPEKKGKAGKEKHPLYHVHYHYRRSGQLCDEWAKDFWKFVEDVGEMRHGFAFTKIDEDLPLSKDNFQWKKKIIINTDNFRERNSAYQRVWREQNPDNVRNHGLKKRFGINLAKYNQMLDAQGGVCGICGRPETAVIRGKVMNLAVDHCHTTGKIRGLLCAHCNHGIGKFEDSEERLQRAIEYLRKFKT